MTLRGTAFIGNVSQISHSDLPDLRSEERLESICLILHIVSASPPPVQLSLGEACDPTNVTHACSSGTICYNVTWLEYDDYHYEASQLNPNYDEYWVDHIEGYMCSRDW